MNGGVAAKVRLAQMASTEEEEDETDDYSEEEFASTILGQDHPTVNCVERRLGSLGEIIDSNPGRLPQRLGGGLARISQTGRVHRASESGKSSFARTT